MDKTEAVLGLVALLVLVVAIPAIAISYGHLESKTPQPAKDLESQRQVLLDLHNSERIGAKLYPSPDLNEIAQAWAERMKRRGRLVHSDMRSNPFLYKGENIASGQTTPEEVFRSWMKSTGHRKNIQNKNFKLVGFGRAGNYWCAVFGG